MGYTLRGIIYLVEKSKKKTDAPASPWRKGYEPVTSQCEAMVKVSFKQRGIVFFFDLVRN